MHFSLIEKVGASVLICAWLIYGGNFLANSLVPIAEGGSSIFAAPAKEEKAPTAAAAAPAAVDLAALLAAADAAAGEKVFGKCKSCHTIEAGGANKVGPNLHNVAGGPVAKVAGFSYSAAFAALGGDWSDDRLNAFLTKPGDYAPGTKMSFAGIGDPKDRANVIAFLKANSAK
jgi:cytochrome c